MLKAQGRDHDSFAISGDLALLTFPVYLMRQKSHSSSGGDKIPV